MSLVKQGLLGKPMAPMLILAGVRGYSGVRESTTSTCWAQQ